MILVGSYLSPFVRRVGVAMNLLDIAFEQRPLRVVDDFDELKTINPVGRVPALILDDGEVLIESAAILDHLDQTVGAERALTPTSGAERRRVMKLVALATGTVEKAVAAVYEGRFRPKEIIRPGSPATK
jgi:glutathione S-transferase